MNDKKFAYYKLEFDDFDLIQELFTPEQERLLLKAIVNYARDGTIMEVPPETQFCFASLRKKQDRAKAKYDELCAKRAESGKKGGTAKARNAAKEVEPVKGKKIKPPPTRKQFRDAFDKLYQDSVYGDDGDERPGDYEVDSFFDELKESDWMIGSEPIRFRKDWEDAITARLLSNHPQYYKAFSYIFSMHKGLRDDTGKSYAEEATWHFFQDYEGPAGNWKQPLDEFLTTWSIPPP